MRNTPRRFYVTILPLGLSSTSADDLHSPHEAYSRRKLLLLFLIFNIALTGYYYEPDVHALHLHHLHLPFTPLQDLLRSVGVLTGDLC